jgi:hypothetical protein
MPGDTSQIDTEYLRPVSSPSARKVLFIGPHGILASFAREENHHT